MRNRSIQIVMALKFVTLLELEEPELPSDSAALLGFMELNHEVKVIVFLTRTCFSMYAIKQSLMYIYKGLAVMLNILFDSLKLYSIIVGINHTIEVN